MSVWGWQPQRDAGVWRHGSPALRPFVAAAPWLTVILLVVMFYLAGGTLTRATGVLVDLPKTEVGDGEVSDSVAVVLPMEHETLVFFDDARYRLSSEESCAAFVRQVRERMTSESQKTLLALVDRRVSEGDLMTLVALARKGGAEKVLLSERRGEAAE